MEEHLRRLSGMAGDVIGNRETVTPPREIHVMTLAQKLECVVENELSAGRCDVVDVAATVLALFCDVHCKIKAPHISWAESEKRGVENLRRGLSFIRSNIEEGRANG